MTKLSLYASAAALALSATAWSAHGYAQQTFPMYTPMPQTQSQPKPYDPQHKSSAQSSQSSSKDFSPYTPMPPAATGDAPYRNLSQAPLGRHGDKGGDM